MSNTTQCNLYEFHIDGMLILKDMPDYEQPEGEKYIEVKYEHIKDTIACMLAKKSRGEVGYREHRGVAYIYHGDFARAVSPWIFYDQDSYILTNCHECYYPTIIEHLKQYINSHN